MGCRREASTAAVPNGAMFFFEVYDLRHISPIMVRSPCGLLVAQANEGSGGWERTPHQAKADDDLPFFPISASPSFPRSEEEHPSERVGRYGVTVLLWEEDSWIDKATVAIAM